MFAKITGWLRRRWRGEQARQIMRTDDGSLPFDLDMVAELIERGDPNDFEDIARRIQG